MIDLDFERNGEQLISKLNQMLKQIGEEQQRDGSYNPKLIEKFLKNTKLSENEFEGQFGKSNGVLLRNILLNWAIKSEKQFINDTNCTELSIKDLARELNIDKWFYELFVQLKTKSYFEDYLFYVLEITEALNDIKQIGNNSNLSNQFDFTELQNTIFKYEQSIHKSLFPQLSTRYNDKDNIIQILNSSYQNIIEDIIYQSQVVIKNFYKNFIPLQKIEECKFYRQGLNILDEFIVKSQISIQNPNNLIKSKLGDFLEDEILKELRKNIHKYHKKIARSLFYDGVDIY
ncbi:unnamed protein product (macronuclear) [Paramecium tetraurelia]|uniref:Uncharacterized protein n=1 Tax=Paramecium tetraurelia TaxID=5888 RepID=A0BYK3_PARTE|nr:uncharacterized protein GSPATT00033473001 [Paramecium tetraurelia]CAK63620.1 unnamed protein product [Paramecium tetraurelia]|eukprot:XP_001431018.1 hypothetical protein (macronuclear) [Paramecium tetraurelia strain d4-2]